MVPTQILAVVERKSALSEQMRQLELAAWNTSARGLTVKGKKRERLQDEVYMMKKIFSNLHCETRSHYVYVATAT